MGYVNPAFMVRHQAADSLVLLGLGIIVGRNATMDNDSKRAVLDRRPGEFGTYVATGSSGGFSISLGFGRFMNRAVIPAGHDLDGDTTAVLGGASLGALLNRGTAVVSGAGVVDYAFFDPGTHEFWAFSVSGTVATDTRTLSELWIGERVEIANADVQPRFTREYEHKVATDVIGGSDLTIELVPPRRRFALSLRYVDPTTDDFTILEEVLRLGRSRSFYYWPPDDSDPGPYLVKLEASGQREQEHPAPKQGIFYSVDLVMVEQAT